MLTNSWSTSWPVLTLLIVEHAPAAAGPSPDGDSTWIPPRKPVVV